MNRWKNSGLVTLSVVLAGTLVLSACSKEGASKNSPEPTGFNKTGLPVVKDKLTLKIAGSKNANVKKDYNQMQMLKKLEQDTNVHVEWDMTPSQGWNEKKNLILASGDLPDVILNISSNDVVKFGPDGLLVPLEGLIDKYAPNIKSLLNTYPEYKGFITASDGHIYSLPRIIEDDSNIVNSMLWVNKTWLDKLNMKVPTNLDEFKMMLKAFKDNDLNGNGKADEIPLSFSMDWFYSAFGSFGITDSANNHIAVKNDKVIFTAIQPEWRDTIKYYSDLAKNGLVDLEATLQKDDQLKGKGSGKDEVLGAVFAYFPATFTTAQRQNDYVPILPNLAGPKGDKTLIGGPVYAFSPGAFAITKSNKSPEATMRWIDQVYEPKTSLQFGYGPIGINFTEGADGKLKRVLPPSTTTLGEFRYSEAPANDFPYIVMSDWSSKNMLPSAEKVTGTNYGRGELAHVYKANIKQEEFPPLMFTVEESDKIASYKTDIIDYVNKMESEWIAKGGIDQAWDTYVDQLKKRGLDDMIKIHQDAYNRYLKSKK